MASPSDNPYAAPEVDFERPVLAEDHAEHEPPRPMKVFLKWLIVCGVSAGPSFFWGVAISGQQVSRILGMVVGVGLFVAAYTLVECTPQVQRLLRRRFARRTAWIGYITRMAISIIFPIGMYLDVIVGLGSVSIGNAVFGDTFGEFGMRSGSSAHETNPLLGFASFLFTTIVQGVFLNIILFAYMLLVHGICWMIASFQGQGGAASGDAP